MAKTISVCTHAVNHLWPYVCGAQYIDLFCYS